MTYHAAGVETEHDETALWGVREWVERTFQLGPANTSVRLPLGYYANVIDVGLPVGIAISTDGVGTKLLVAQLMDKFDTVGIDCVAMNVNDVICVGAEPVTMVDYVAVERADSHLLSELAKGLFEGARRAHVSIPGGEIAQIREMIRGPIQGKAFDLVGTCVGTVALDRILCGQDTRPGDAIIGVRSSGIHSNGSTLARKVFFDTLHWNVDRHVPEFGRSLGEELLEPTQIYVSAAMGLLKSGISVRSFAHITSDGFLNLLRADATVAYVIDSLPEPQPIFDLIGSGGQISVEEMFLVYNMGIGLCAVVSSDHVDKALGIIRSQGFDCQQIGFVESSAEKVVRLPQYSLTGRGTRFLPEG
jgi:phosphoribosylformylglycinamidine cyclo-ligase